MNFFSEGYLINCCSLFCISLKSNFHVKDNSRPFLSNSPRQVVDSPMQRVLAIKVNYILNLIRPYCLNYHQRCQGRHKFSYLTRIIYLFFICHTENKLRKKTKKE